MPLSLQSSSCQSVEIASSIDADGRQWVQLATFGSMKTVDGRGPYKVTAPADIIAASFRSGRTDKLPVDYDHAIDVAAPKGLPAPAAGWISRMEARSDGIWGLVEWTPNAVRQITEKEYRFLSPVIMHTSDNEVLAIVRASLTNNPNLTLKSLNAAEQGHSMDQEQFIRELRAALGLPEDASEAAIIEAAKTTKSTNSADPARFVPIETFQQTVAELNKLRSGLSLESAEREVDIIIREGRLLPFMRDWAISLCQSNSAAFEDFLDGAGKPIAGFITSLQSPGADWGKLHAADTKKQEGAVDSDVNRVLGLSSEDVKNYGGKA